MRQYSNDSGALKSNGFISNRSQGCKILSYPNGASYLGKPDV
jgi:hypothetical protein